MRERHDGKVWGPAVWNIPPFRPNGPFRTEEEKEFLLLDCSTATMTRLTKEQQFITFKIVLKEKDESFVGLKKQWPDEDKGLLHHLKRFMHDGIYSDVQFMVKGEKIPGHILIIQEGSPVLAAMFENEMTEASSRIVVIEDVEPDIFRRLLYFLYTGKVSPRVEVEDEMIEPLFIAADKYQVEALKERCGLAMSKKLRIGNAMRFLVLAHLHSAKRLEDDCICFIVQKKTVFWELPEFQKLGEKYFKLFYDLTSRMNMST